KKVLLDDVSPGRVGLGCRRRPTPNWRLATDRAPGAKRPGLCQPYGEDSADVALICKAAGRLNEEKRGCTRLTARLRPESSKSIMPESTEPFAFTALRRGWRASCTPTARLSPGNVAARDPALLSISERDQRKKRWASAEMSSCFPDLVD